MASSSTSSFEMKYPSPSKFNVREFVPELNEYNYNNWNKLMVGFIKCQGLSSFIDDTDKAPPKTVPASDDGVGGEEVENEEYRYWERSNVLVRGWIMATLPKNILQQVLSRRTAREVWTQLNRMFNPFHDIPLDEEREKSLSTYRLLHIAAIKGDWESARKFIQEKPDAVRAPITLYSETALHVAIRLVQRNHFVKKLVEKMSLQDLTLPANAGETALHSAAALDNIEAAKLLVEKNSNLPNVSTRGVELPVHLAAARGNREMVSYLLKVTRLDGQNESGAELLCALTSGGLYDIALTLLQRYPKWACMEECSPLMQIIEKRSSFRCETSLNFWQNLIYTKKQRLHAMFWKVAENFVPQMKYIREMKLMRHQALELVKLLCEEVAKSDFTKAARIFMPVLFKAISVGIHEIVEEILGTFPSVISLSNLREQTIFQYAVVCRRENVFNLIYQLKESSWMGLTKPDALGNNGLHLAGYLGPEQQLSLRVSAAGAALQMHRELQWFKEVEKLVHPKVKDQRNADGMIPAEVFTNTHQELVKEGEQWMKDTANSCTIVAALIATVVFAAAITIPAITSVLMFLSILTARYAEQDFLYALPKRLIIGLGTLFVSMLSTMIAFGATLYLVFGDNKAWILIPIVALACMPVTLFIALQFPLLVAMTKSTYGPGIFRKQSDRMIY